MPRLTESVPKYRKHSSGQAFVELAGHRHYLGPWKTKASKIEYDRLIAEWLINGRRALHQPQITTVTVVELCNCYRKFAEGYYVKDGKPTCLDRIRRAVSFLRAMHGHIGVAEFGPLSLKAIRQLMVDEGLSRTYVNQLTETIRRIFKWGVAEQLVPSAVFQALETVTGLRRGRTEARETEPVRPIDEATVTATLPHLPAVVADMVWLQWLTGARPDEVCLVRPGDIDRSGDVWFYRPASHKTQHHGRERVIFIGPRAQTILRRYLDREADSYCFCPIEAEAMRRAAQHLARKTPLSCGNRPGTNRKAMPKRSAGQRYSPCSYRRAIHRACDLAFPHPDFSNAKASKLSQSELAELKSWQSQHRWSPNQLRHAAATTVRREFGLEAAQVVLGHSQANVTQVYAERDTAKGIEVARKIG